MKKFLYTVLLILSVAVTFESCSDTETYAEQRDRERQFINTFIVANKINVISETQFLKDTVTDVSKNQYVLFENTGVYMQIVNRGTGTVLPADGKPHEVLCRYDEYNIQSFSDRDINTVPRDSCTTSNQVNLPTLGNVPEKMSVINTSGTFEASFIEGVMLKQYGASVPAGWLFPLTYLRLDRYINEKSTMAEVKLIVPHGQGHQKASEYVAPFYYHIYYMMGK